MEYEEGKLAIFGRNAKGFLLAAYSNDMGVTWTVPEKIEMAGKFYKNVK